VAVVDVECSAGTYVRSLARDLGAAVGSAAYLGALVRTASGPFGVENAIDLETIRAAAAEEPAAIERLLLPVDAGLDELPRLTVDAATIGALARGQVAPLPDGVTAPADTPILVVDEGGRLVAVATVSDGRLAPDKVLVDLADVVAASAPQ
jgi:tRNA pseudouridine55 synthase